MDASVRLCPLAHLRKFRTRLEPKPGDWQSAHSRDEWQGRKPGSYAWYEIQDSVDYWEKFEKPKIIYQVIQFYSSYALDKLGRFSNDKTFIISTDNLALLATLNSPLMWWRNWRSLPHLKDEALSPMGYLVENFPIVTCQTSVPLAERLAIVTDEVARAIAAIHDWLRIEFHIDRPGRALEAPERLDADSFAAAVRAALPRRKHLSAAEIARLKREHTDTIAPARRAAAEVLRLESRLSDLVNQAYGLTPEEVALMWSTAPPRMPLVAPATPRVERTAGCLSEE